jgi:carboxypeptidase C (cathepsin A)
VPDDKKPDDKPKGHPPRPERSSSAPMTTTIGGRELAITASAATLNLKDDRGEDRASVFLTAYTLDGADPATRPVTFCFNGGPGSSSVWLHFGAFGPRRVDVPDALSAPPPPYRVVDNAFGLLDVSDLVFIDPVGTGFSRVVGETAADAFQSVEDDASSVGEAIERWLGRHGRWSSPKFLAGESYGTTRGAALAKHLHDRGIALNGLVLVSIALNFQTFVSEPGNDLPDILYLPALAAVAWYHGRLAGDWPSRDALIAEVKSFALDIYAPALLRGSGLDPATKRDVAAMVARYTGLPASAIEQRNLRVEYLWFCKQVLGVPGRAVGRLDARYLGDDSDPHAPQMQRDVSYDAILAPFASAVNDQLRRTLAWTTDDPYHVLSTKVNEGWRWRHGKRLGYINVTEDLRAAMLGNPHLKVMFANGIYDLATPFSAAEFTADHLGVEPALRRNVRLTYYEAGHMMYLHPPSLAKLKADLAAFYADAIPG